jgi:acyl-CoA reductase-like NAD-dependent aldehyde dehydrogenase
MASAPLSRSLAVANPRTGIDDYRIEPLDSTAVAALATRLRAAQPDWAALSLAARLEALGAFFTALDGHADAIMATLSQDTGRRAIARVELDGIKTMLACWSRDAPGLVNGVESQRMPTAVASITPSTRLHPYPLVGVISPWNCPLTLTLTLNDAILALAAGCAVIVNPSEITPRFIRSLMQAIDSVPALASVFAVIESDGDTGAALVDIVDFIAFAGSVATGRKVGESAARAFIPVNLELGGKDPMLVLASANPVAAANTGAFGLSGLGPSRMGASGRQRFFRRQALLRQTGAPLPLAAYAERG